MIRIFTSLLFAFACCSVVLFGCSKGHQNQPVVTPPANPAAPVPTITTFSPASGGDSTTLVITGANFSITTTLDTVKINGKPAKVVSATATSITVIVPAGAGTGPVSVTVNGNTAVGATFNYTSSLWVISIAGNGVNDFNSGASTISTINFPGGVAVDLQGNVYVSEYNRIKKLTPAGQLTVLAGNGIRGFKDTLAAYAEFSPTTGIAVDQNGNVYVADRDNSRIRKIGTDGRVTTFAGNGVAGHVDGPGASAEFWTPNGVAADAQGNLFVTDYSNKVIRKISPDGTVSTVAGDGNTGFRDGPGNQAEFDDIESIATDDQDNLYVVEEWNQRVRKITAAGVVSTYLGTPTGLAGNAGNVLGIAVDKKHNVYVTVEDAGTIELIPAAGGLSTYAGTVPGYLDGPAAKAEFNLPSALAVDTSGNVYVADLGNGRIRKIVLQ